MAKLKDVYHLSCGRGYPLGAKLFKNRFKGHMECHCLLFQGQDGLVLVDAGLSRQELLHPKSMGCFARSLGLQSMPELAAFEQIRALGLKPESVSDIVLTHLDLDHAGGLVDFPNARVHISSKELAAAKRLSTFSERLRYRSQQFEHCQWVTHEPPSPPDIENLPVILRVGDWQLSYFPLFGHTRGHCGVLARSNQACLLHCGDAYYDRSELSNRGSFLFRRFKGGIDWDLGQADESRQRLQALTLSRPNVQLLSSHDPSEFAAYAKSV